MRPFLSLLGCGLALSSVSSPTHALDRLALSSLTLPAEAPAGDYITENALGGMYFDAPVAITAPPGETNRLFVAERSGTVAVVPNLAAPTRAIFLDLTDFLEAGGEKGLLGLAFHPDYAANGFFYVFYTARFDGPEGYALYDIVARFSVDPQNPNEARRDSEQRLIVQRDEADNHNGGDLHFGPDGYLYVSLGDEGGGGDAYDNGQRIDRDFFAGILRLDVDRKPGSLTPNPHPAVQPGTYAIPPDNPFIGATTFGGLAVDPATLRTEFFAGGLRNPWRFAFDPASGRLYAADVGQDLFEEVDWIQPGGNYGWPWREGFQAFQNRTNPPAGLAEPLFDYPHQNSGSVAGGWSITGGIVYRGSQYADLFGAYLFIDYVSGRLWSLHHDTVNPVRTRLLLGSRTEGGIAGMGINPRNGEILLADLGENKLKRLVRASGTSSPFPAKLSDTGAFANLAQLQPVAGFVPYEVNVPFWSDHAHKRRWFGQRALAEPIEARAAGAWTFPAGTVWMKHFEIETVRGDPLTRKRLETRFLVRNPQGSVYGVTYRWNDAGTDADLVPEGGANQSLALQVDGQAVNQNWRFPSRAECLACHTPNAGYALGFDTVQLNRLAPDDPNQNQIDRLRTAGYLSGLTTPGRLLPALAPASDASRSLSWRLQSYLHANCAACHLPGGPAPAGFDARVAAPLRLAGLINGALNDNLGDAANRVIVPGDPARSVLLRRVENLGPGHMPPIASGTVNREAVDLLYAWIAELQAQPELAAAPPAVPLTVERQGSQTWIHFAQPAGVATPLEWSSDLRTWTVVDTPGNGVNHPAESTDRSLNTPANQATGFWRVTSQR